MTRLRFTMLVVAVASAVGVGVAVVEQDADAARAEYYCQILVNPKTACSDVRVDSAVTFNVASYDGSGSVSVCERANLRFNNSTMSRRCRIGYASSEQDLAGCVQYTCSLDLRVGNDDDNRHTIKGYHN